MGSPFEFLYAVRSGFLQSRSTMADGREQVTGFHLPGDLVGMDGIASGAHVTEVLALEDAEVCVIPRARLDEFDVQRQVQAAMARELARTQGMMLLLGILRAEERLAAFLVAFSQRLRALGDVRDEFNLRMTRLQIGSYLGMSLETVCRMLARLRKAGLISVRQKRIRIVDRRALIGAASAACEAVSMGTSLMGSNMSTRPSTRSGAVTQSQMR